MAIMIPSLSVPSIERAAKSPVGVCGLFRLCLPYNDYYASHASKVYRVEA
ncbi:MAG: hypothetical protein QXR17_03415 [Candidatus Bathyarchaeia archaeon]